jgi:hypothetical protein
MMEASILDVLLPALNATSVIAFWGWYQADKRALSERKENKENQDKMVELVERQAENQQRTADVLTSLIEKIGLL